MPTIQLLAEKAKPIWLGHPWIFPKAIAKQSGDFAPGTLVTVQSADGQFMGVGMFNPHSLYRVRMLAYGYEAMVKQPLQDIISTRLQQARDLRLALQLPNADTTAYRLFNSEGDGLSGLTVDCYGDILVVASSAYWVELHRETIENSLKAVYSPTQILWFPQQKPLQQDGFETEKALHPDTQHTEVLEAGVRYQIQFNNSQKTGLFLDQRENHARIGALAKGKRVLDLYCYTGGFSLHAAKGGASAVVGVDSSEPAIERARSNAQLNHLTQVEFIADNAQDHLSKAANFDLIILDPPKLAPSRQHVGRAMSHYQQLHQALFQTMKSDSLLFTCNCSSAISRRDFSQMLMDLARQYKRRLQVLGSYGAAADHPLLPAFPEGDYFNALLLRIV
jgi:23S rRNA (cytosine1962-C5)-methyltransferase